MIPELLKETERKMKVSIDHLIHELGKVRTGRANLGILEDVKADFYGTPTPLAQMATLGVPDSQTLSIQPWDATGLAAIEKAIQASNLGLTPSNDGKVIRLSIPPLTTERRKELAKTVKKYAEDCRVAVRNVRRECNDKTKALEKDHSISEDDHKRCSDDVQKLTDGRIAEIDKIAQSKEKDLMGS